MFLANRTICNILGYAENGIGFPKKRVLYDICDFSDRMQRLNALNTELQGNGELICDLMPIVDAFSRKYL